MPLHLDNAGAPMIIPEVIDAWSEDVKSNYIPNPHSQNSDYISTARKAILAHLNTSLKEYSVIFTQNSTAALGIIANSINWNGKIYAYHPHSHTSVLGIRQIVHSRGGSFKCSSSATGFLYAYPAQSNFCGSKFRFPDETQSLILVDTASLLATSKFDLSAEKADFLTVSFYKMFGFPTGLGALIVKSSVLQTYMSPSCFGGGSILGSNTGGWNLTKPGVESYELEIKAVLHGFDYINNNIGWYFIHSHTYALAEKARKAMSEMSYANNSSLVMFYPSYPSLNPLGPIINFNLLNSDGSFIGYSTLSKLASLSNIIIRVGCFCNPGACEEYLKTDTKETYSLHGHVCGDEVDLIHGMPTGSCRISFGFQNSIKDLVEWCAFLNRYFLQSETISLTVTAKNNATLSEIFIYPIKSCGAMQVSRSYVSTYGLLNDRKWVVVNEESGKAVTQMQCPKMCLIQPIEFINESLIVKIGNNFVSLSPSLNSSISDVKVCGNRKTGAYHLNLKQASSIVSEFLDIKCSFAYATDTSFSNHSQSLLLISQASVDYLNKKSSKEISASSFRANLITSGIEAFAEEGWISSDLEIGNVKFRVESACQRCRMVCIDQESGNFDQDTLSTLAINHRLEGRIVFGVYLKPLDEGYLDVGQKVEEKKP